MYFCTMDKVIKFYKLYGETEKPFPSEDEQIVAPEQIVASEFTYSAKRMGGAPTITCTIRHKDVLDGILDESVYVLFNDEKLYLKHKPTSSFDNNDCRYKYELEFISERSILDNVYFFDVVGDSAYKGASNTTKFNFSGDISEFVKRLNASLAYSGLERYEVKIDEGITSEMKHVSFEDQFISNALQEIYNTYELPYYFIGYKIHVGTAPKENELSEDEKLKYGVDNNLLSITKQSANNKIVNRITGYGSTENIPYYYPNPTPLGEVDLDVSSSNPNIDHQSFVIENAERVCSKIGLDGTIELNQYKANTITQLETSYSYGSAWLPAIDKDGNQEELGYRIFNGTEDNSSGSKSVYKYKIKISGETSERSNSILKMLWKPDDQYNPIKYKETHPSFQYSLFDNLTAYEVINGKTKQITPTIDGTTSMLFKIPFSGWSGQGHNYFEIILEFSHLAIPSYTGIKSTNFYDIGLSGEQESTTYAWVKSDGTQSGDLKYFGLDYYPPKLSLGDYVGTKITLIQRKDENDNPKYITPSPNLMPSIYRKSWGIERFYNAIDGEYENEDGVAYVFPNPYKDGHPREHVEEFSDIKPTIVGINNKAGKTFNKFVNIAYDDNDNDTLNDSGVLEHQFFYVQLPVYDGDYGFNLFDCINEKGEMTFSMTSGVCGACSFKVAVHGETNENRVQVDEQGNLIKDEQGRVLFGEPQARQNDTRTNSVWLALYKDKDTFATTMPNVTRHIYPSTGDTFVILNITLPTKYVKAAEERLDKELIRFMHENNDHKFNFSVKLSRIYFEENPTVLKKLTENSKVLVEYQGKSYSLFVSSYSYKMSSNSILPEVAIELADTLSVGSNSIDNIVRAVKMDVESTMASLDVVSQARRVFIQKEADDSAFGYITFDKGFSSVGDAMFGNFASGHNGVGIYRDEINQWYVEADYLKARKKLIANTVDIEETKHIGGQQILTAASATLSAVVTKGDYFRCYFPKQDTEGNFIDNKWQRGDLAYCKEFNYNSGSKEEGEENDGEVEVIEETVTEEENNSEKAKDKFYWRKVLKTSNDTEDDETTIEVGGVTVVTSDYHFIDLSNRENEYATHSDTPTIYDSVVQLGHVGNDESRQNAIIMAGAGKDSPYIRQYVGIGKDTKNLFTLPEVETQIQPNKNIFSGQIIIKEGSSGLENTKEWGEVSSSVTEAEKAAKEAKEAADKAAQDAADAIGSANEAIEAIEKILQDGVVSPLEMWVIKNEQASIDADKVNIDTQCETYNLKGEYNYVVYTEAYNDYANALDAIIKDDSDNPSIPDNIDTLMSAYYAARNTILNDIAEASKTRVEEIATQIAAFETQVDNLKGSIDGFEENIGELNRRLDGVIENYFFEGVPDVDNYPAEKWTTENDKANHVGDTYTNIQEYVDDKTTPDAGKSWRWTPADEDNNGYHWHLIADSDAVKALLAASEAKSNADGKARTFVNEPRGPYSEGDLWLKEDDKAIYVCTKGRLEGFDSSEWKPVTRTTTEEEELIESIVKDVRDQVDGKAETWYQDDDPASKWTTNDEKDKHVGDLWYDTKNKKNYIYTKEGTKYSWVEIDGVPDELYDKIDGKADVFVGGTAPQPPYNKNDLWIKTNDDGTNTIYRCQEKRAEGEQAGEKDWVIVTESITQEDINGINGNIDKLQEQIEYAAEELENVYDKSEADGIISEAEQRAINAAKVDLQQAQKELEKYMYNQVNGIVVGGQNLLLNSGFTGSYDVISLEGDSTLDEMYDTFNPSTEYWGHLSTGVKAINDDYTITGKAVEIRANNGIWQNIRHKIYAKTYYVISFSAKGGQIYVRFGGQTSKTFTLDQTTWNRYTWVVETAEEFDNDQLYIQAISLSYIGDVMLERGNTASEWKPSPFDNRSAMAKFEEFAYLQELLKVPTVIGDGQIQTGVVNTGLINMGNYVAGQRMEVTSGVSGLYNDENSVAFFGGGDLAKASFTVGKYKADPHFVPTDDELKEMAQFVVTHGGRAILQDVILRGTVYATDGEFRGTVYAKDGEFTGTVNATDGVFNGTVNTVDGSFDGNIDLKGTIVASGTGNNRFNSIKLNGVNRKLEITGPSEVVDDWGTPAPSAISKTYVSLGIGNVVLANGKPYVSADIVFGDPYTAGASVGTHGFQFKGQGLQSWLDGTTSQVTNEISIDGTISQFHGLIRFLGLPTKSDYNKLPGGCLYRDGETLKIKV